MPIIQRLVPIVLIAVAIAVAGLAFLAPDQAAGAATPRIGCPAETLTVRTGQRFYHTIVVNDIADLYAWQTDVTYNDTYLAYQGFVVGDFLRRDGAALYSIAPTAATGRVDDLAVTRLARHVGQDGSGPVAHVFFTALRNTGTGRTAAKVTGALLVDRNAIEISKGYIDHGNCWTIIQDDAPVLVQPPVGLRVYLPLILR